tara:strand:+ start:425 stop:715 length:291 start_codon:yes stop_codon:yes gene_type:complete
VKIKVMADYDCAPLWWDDWEHVGDIRPEDIGLSRQLVADLWAWAGIYDATLDRDDPRASGFASKVEEQAFEEQGRLLSRSVASELVGCEVRYWRDA